MIMIVAWDFIQKNIIFDVSLTTPITHSIRQKHSNITTITSDLFIHLQSLMIMFEKCQLRRKMDVHFINQFHVLFYNCGFRSSYDMLFFLL